MLTKREWNPDNSIAITLEGIFGLAERMLPKIHSFNVIDRDGFWQTMRHWSKDNIVIISHYDAPADFKCVREIPTIHGMRRNQPGPWDGKIERLYMLEYEI